ncbi:transposase [Streptomyces sp. NPDC052236]|uniref:transposase n=1 Tax=Streptomyces sp. NPDC052236 TaxID=3365686 RepID=UPI0037D2B28E
MARAPTRPPTVHQEPVPALPAPHRTAPHRTAPSAPPPAKAPGTWAFPQRELHDLQARVRTGQQTPDWQARYAVRSGAECTVNEFAHGHGMRRCPYRGHRRPTHSTSSRPSP